ncbi:MAG: TFIIB-type zinc ribbon-containing protein [Clostridia bacterium]|nr:TFIIB-type zinc ribbon-containing protein [Clostridia bacterium]
MASTVTYSCLNCGAGLTFNADKQKFCCEYCGSEFEEQELKDSLAAEKAREKEEEERAQKEQEEREKAFSEEFSSQMNEYQCPSCGAEVIADDKTVAHFCAYCHNPVVMLGRLSGAMRPQRVVPFAFGKEEAEKKFTAFAKKKWFAPWDFCKMEKLEKTTGIYYPFWVTDADTDSILDTRARRVRRWRTGNYEHTETSNYRIYRRGNIHFEDIVTSAYSEQDKELMEGILPYPSEDLKEFDYPFLQGFFAKKRDIERKDVTQEVKNRMFAYSRTLLRGTISGYTSVDSGTVKMKVNSSIWEYALMPVYILTYKDRKGKAWTFGMNGDTGKIYGKMPIAWTKLAILLAGIVAPLTVLLSFILSRLM